MGIPGYSHFSDTPILMGPRCDNKTQLGVCLKMVSTKIMMINQKLWGIHGFSDSLSMVEPPNFEESGDSGSTESEARCANSVCKRFLGDS